jgi:hypothetical protein
MEFSLPIKKFSLFLFLALCASLGYGQSYEPLPDSAGRWVNTLSHVENQNGSYYCKFQSATTYCSNGSDTIIGSKNYFKIRECQGAYKGAMRNDSGKVFFVPRDSSSESLLYDFTASVGDTINDVLVDRQGSSVFDLYDLPVKGVDSIEVNGDYRKRLHIKDGDWVEGIGNTSKGLFLETWSCACPYCWDLHCMSEKDTTLYPTVEPGSCALDVAIEENKKRETPISIRPNPVKNGPLQVTLPPGADEVRYELRDRTGRCVQEGIIEGDRIPMPDRRGVYFLRLHLKSGGSVRKVMVH